MFCHNYNFSSKDIVLIIDARGASITYGHLGGVVCGSVVVHDFLFCLVWAVVAVGGGKVVYGYVFECAEHDKHDPGTICIRRP